MFPGSVTGSNLAIYFKNLICVEGQTYHNICRDPTPKPHPFHPPHHSLFGHYDYNGYSLSTHPHSSSVHAEPLSGMGAAPVVGNNYPADSYATTASAAGGFFSGNGPSWFWGPQGDLAGATEVLTG